MAAKRVMELRYDSGSDTEGEDDNEFDEEEEREWSELFANGIHYMHMVRLIFLLDSGQLILLAPL